MIVLILSRNIFTKPHPLEQYQEGGRGEGEAKEKENSQKRERRKSQDKMGVVGQLLPVKFWCGLIL